MSIDPPQTAKGSTGPIVILVFVSILLLAAMAVFGMLAFDILPGRGDNTPDPVAALEASDFTIVRSASGESSSTIQVDVVVTNTSNTPVENAQIIVQCEDSGYVSAIKDVPPLESEAKAQVPLQLNGTGSPSCSEPDISFSAKREDE